MISSVSEKPGRRFLARVGRLAGALLLVGAYVLAAHAPRGAAASRAPERWIGAWASPPSDGGTGGLDLAAGLGVDGLLDPSLHLKLPVDDETLRVLVTPTYGGSTLRLHLSNQFGTATADFAHVTVARAGAGAALAAPATTVTFDGSESVSVPPGQNVVSDPVSLTFAAMQTLAVSMYVADDPGYPTEHYIARQTSYFTPAHAGDQTTDIGNAAFTGVTTTRDYVDGIDVLAPRSAGAVVAFGDSLTDGYQGDGFLGTPEAGSTLNTNTSWPDDLARRLIAARVPLSVLNEGISANRVVGGGGIGGPSALNRLQADVLDQAGVTTVVWLEGINDFGSTNPVTADQLEAAWTRGIATMQAAGLTVLQGTLTPSGGADGGYGTAATNTIREQLNEWIRTKSPANVVVDFDAVANSTDTALKPVYDDGDHLHMNPAGYQAMANAIDLAALQRAQPSTGCARTRRARRRHANHPPDHQCPRRAGVTTRAHRVDQ
jgi:lysophospholipase L1-like esterase